MSDIYPKRHPEVIRLSSDSDPTRILSRINHNVCYKLSRMWTRIDDSFYDHYKVERAGNAACGAWLRMNTYCARHGTGGFLDASKALYFCEADEKQLQRLLDTRMLDETDTGYKIHDYEKYNPDSKEKHLKRSENAKHANAVRWGKKS